MDPSILIVIAAAAAYWAVAIRSNARPALAGRVSEAQLRIDAHWACINNGMES